MAHYSLAPQAIVTYELLVGTDGTEKMSKSTGNYVGIDEPPRDQFGKVMSVPDAALAQWWRLALDTDPPELEPMESKLELARGVVARYHGEDAAREAEAHFTRVVREGRPPDESDVPVAPLPGGDPVHVPAALAAAFPISTSEARRLIAQGAVELEGERLDDLDVPRDRIAGALVRVGKRRFVRFQAS
jgi:tyrosyl-tRNA synthetase